MPPDGVAMSMLTEAIRGPLERCAIIRGCSGQKKTGYELGSWNMITTSSNEICTSAHLRELAFF